MIQKRKAYKNYGGRGIKMCDEWKMSYINFKKWFLNELNKYIEEHLSNENISYDEKIKIAKDILTIDRIDNNGDYGPSNCRLTTYKIQARNTRSNVLSEEINKTIKDLHKIGYSCRKIARIFNIYHSTVCRMLKGITWKN